MYICTLIYLRSCTSTDTLRDDADVNGDVPQDVLLNPENGGIEARRPFSRAYLCARVRVCMYVCATLRVELERSGVQAGWRRCRGTEQPRSSDRFETTPGSLATIPPMLFTLYERPRDVQYAR